MRGGNRRCKSWDFGVSKPVGAPGPAAPCAGESWEEGGGIFTSLCLAPAAACPRTVGDVGSSCFSSMDLSFIAQGERALQRALSILQQPAGWQAETLLVKPGCLLPFTAPRQKSSRGEEGAWGREISSHLEGTGTLQETCRAKACGAKRVSKPAFVKRVRKQICKVNRQREKAWRGKLGIMVFPGGKARSVSAGKPNR